MKNFVFLLLLATGLILAVRQWCVASYWISTPAMEEALHSGDFVLVDKWAAKAPKRNGVVLFSSPLSRDSLHSPLLVSRCMGLPGDTVVVEAEGYVLNGQKVPLAPQSLQTWYVGSRWKDDCLKALQTLHVPLREWKQADDGYTLRLTPLETARINQEMEQERAKLQLSGPAISYQVVLPRKGRAYRLDEYSLLFCQDAILQETGGQAKFRDGKLYLDGRETTFFFFQQDYYWLLSDNPQAAVDSRYLGIIPADHLVGRVRFCWFSSDKNRIFTRVY